MTAQAKTKTYGPVDVTADEIVAFHAGINHTGDAASSAAHPFFCARVLIPGSAEALFATGVDINRIVHAGIELSFRRTIRAGDALSQVSVPQGVEEKGSGKLVGIGITIRDAEDAVVVDGVTRYFSRGEKKRDTKPKPEETPWLTGAPVFEGTVATKPDQSLLYAEGSGDRFPIHTDDAFAKMVGLPGVIMHGMCTLALSVNALVADQLEGDLERLAGVRCRFARIVLPGEALTVTATREGEEIRFETHNAQGEPVISEGVVRARS